MICGWSNSHSGWLNIQSCPSSWFLQSPSLKPTIIHWDQRICLIFNPPIKKWSWYPHFMTHQPSTNHHAPSFWGGDHPWKWSIIYHHLSPSIVETLLNLVNYTNLAIENRIQIPCWMLNFHQPNQDSHEFSINYVPVFLVNHGFTYGSTYSFPHLGQCQASQGATHRCRRTNGDDQQRMPQGQLRHPPLHALQQLGPAIAVEEDLVATLGTWGPTWMSGEFWGL